ncbi:MAG: shikimate dehydrogenase [Candidatus Tectomicrobia bacterium]|uniref:Shikimate dehydrogenase (NADP(+)) n=1 Tax=Tectimicrobiota bacterium TaxID=2528274 RepID=A0A932FZL2_UNCTE|nr:shikimate dehydrogenase [Candidatus Tectomicrobia bacterium]
MGPIPKVLGILGDPIGHTLSPLMHHTAAQYHTLEMVYLPFWVKPEQLPAAVQGIRGLGIVGVNITIPHKQAVLPLVDEVTPEAQLIGALNTLHHVEGRLIGYNTDGPGFIASLREDASEEPRGKRVVLLGAGGAARGLAIHLTLEGVAELILTNRTLERAQQLTSYVQSRLKQAPIRCLPWESRELEELLPQADILINSTSVGMRPDDPPLFPYDRIRPHQLICDIVYRPLETPLLRQARQQGARALDGLGMLIRQGALAFQIWTGREMPVGLVRQVLLEALGVKTP